MSVIAVLLAVVFLSPASGSDPASVTATAAVVAKPQCSYSLSRIKVHRSSAWRLQRTLGREPTRTSSARIVGCKYARWVEHLWWNRTVKLAKRARWVVLPDVRDWATAVGVVQRVYPGTASWLLSCSSAEGGHGPWVWYGHRFWTGSHIGNDFLGMDTVGGWMQFRYSTFRVYEPDAFATTRARGFVIPSLRTPGGGDARYAGWLSPLGQALTAGYMRYFHKDGHHWAASSSNGC